MFYMRYLVCSREGRKSKEIGVNKSYDGDDGGMLSQKRRRTSNRVGCDAKVGFRKVRNGGFIVCALEERHNHPLCSEVSKAFMKANRQLDLCQQTFIANCLRANIGPVQCFQLYKEFMGGFENVGATCVEFCNFKRDFQVYVDGKDAELIIGKLTEKKELWVDYYFAYDVDAENRMSRLFWADPVGRRQFACFGDVISFDATYRSNRYNLVFVPFTGIDNHKRCVTFAAGLLTKEDVDSYVWLLEQFKEAMDHSPSCIVTDQDPAMKIAVPQVFTQARHRFCMWHIMTKVGEKVGVTLAKDEVFRQKLNALVWNDTLTVNAFETGWQSLMVEYGLGEHRWFQQLFGSRASWILAFFNDLFLGGLLRTTSRSEATNSFFRSFTNHYSSLVEFFFHYDCAIEAQRHTQDRLNAECEAFSPVFKTPLPIERHAAGVYSIKIFYEVQAEIVAACFTCRVLSISRDGEYMCYEVKSDADKVFSVRHNPNDNSTACCCGLFNRVGILCRHIFLVFKDCRVENIPPSYVVERWGKGTSMRVKQPINRAATQGTHSPFFNQLWLDIHACVIMAQGNEDRTDQLTQVISVLKNKFMSDGAMHDPSTSNHSVIQKLCGVTSSSMVNVQPPVVAKNKGSGKRLKSARELGSDLSMKPKRKCRSCKQLARHDSRNCPSVQ